MNEFINLSRALSDPSRVRILMALRGDELCVCHLVELLRLAPSTVSKHLSVLRQAGLVELRKDGRWANYRITSQTTTAVSQAIRWMMESTKSSQMIRDDRKRLKEILKCDREELCNRTGKS